MKVGIYVPADDLGELRVAVLDRWETVGRCERNSVGFPGERAWRKRREALERILAILKEAS